MATTLRDIADHCGVAVSTVSRALRNDGLVTPKTRQRITEIALRMGYTPNAAARTLVGSRTNTVWLLVSDLMNLYQQTIAEYTSRFLADNGYDMSVVSYHKSPDRYIQLLRRLSHGISDGAIVISMAREGERELELLERKGFPLVFADRNLESAHQPTVTTDNVAGTVTLLEMMLRQGAERFIILFTERNSVERTRFHGAVEYLGRHGIPFILGDGFDLSFLSGTGRIGILGTWQSDLEEFIWANLPLPKKSAYLYGVFDTWYGEPYPASRVFVCKQDFKEIAEQSARQLLRLLRGEDIAESLSLIPPAEYETVNSKLESAD